MDKPEAVVKVHTNDALLKGTTGWAAYLRIFSFADRISLALYVLGLLALAACGTSLPLLDLVFGQLTTSFNGFATNATSGVEFMDKVVASTLILVYILVGKFVLFYFGMMAVSTAATRTAAALRLAFVTKILRHEIAYFDSNDPSTVAVQITNNGNQVQQGVAEKLALIVQAVAALITAVVIALYTQWKLALITICIIPAIVISTAVSVVIDIKQEANVSRIYSSASEIAAEALSQIKMVHALWGQPRILERYDAILDNAQREGMKKSLNYGIMFSSEFFLVLSGYALSFWQGSRMFASGEITEPGDILVVIFAVLVAANSLTQVAPLINVLSRAASAAENMLVVIDRQSALDPLDATGHKLDIIQGDIRMRNVSFSYPSRPDVQILKDLMLHIPAGKTTAIVGTSGSGKSTIVGLLERWYDCPDGSIELDGVNIRDLNVQWLRSQIGLVQQEPVLFSGTIFDNVRQGLKSPDSLSEEKQMELVQRACEAANANEFIQKLPEGYHTAVGQRGGLLSGGQKQRIAIARTIISDPKILLLDEATSALDPVAEGKVQIALDAVRQSRTTVMIAHKLSTIKRADNIIVLGKGELIEQGTHAELLEKQGTYYSLVVAQDLGGDSDGSDTEENPLPDMQTLCATDTQAKVNSMGALLDHDFSQSAYHGILQCIWIFISEQGADWPWLLLVALGCCIGGLTYPALAFIISRLIGVFSLPVSSVSHESNFYALMLFVVALLNLFSYFITGFASNVLGQHITRRYRAYMLKWLIYQDMAFFDSPDNTTGTLVSRLSTAPSKVQELLGFNVAIMIVMFVNLVSTCVVALAFGWKLGLVVIAGMLIPLTHAAFARYYAETRLESIMEKKFASGAAAAAEAITSIRTIASLGLEEQVIGKYRESLHTVVHGSIARLYFINFFFSLAQAIEFGAVALAFWYGAKLLVHGEYSVPQFFVVLLAALFSGEACLQIVVFTSSLSQAKSGANYILWLKQQTPTITEKGSAGSITVSEGKGVATLSTRALKFSYGGRHAAPVIRGIDMDISPGDFVAFVGASGCGKSTMVSLIERFYDASHGAIRYFGQDLRDLCPREYRQNLGYVQQEPMLLSGSIRDNINFGSDQALADGQMLEACKQANIHDFVLSLPDGLETRCGSAGTQLSGGQRQRVAIARALARRPKVLLLDEATSALDTESERIVQTAIMAAAEGRTTIAIAHRLSTIKHADHIHVFHRGRVVESGTHNELLERRGIYHSMCLSQSLR